MLLLIIILKNIYVCIKIISSFTAKSFKFVVDNSEIGCKRGKYLKSVIISDGKYCFANCTVPFKKDCSYSWIVQVTYKYIQQDNESLITFTFTPETATPEKDFYFYLEKKYSLRFGYNLSSLEYIKTSYEMDKPKVSLKFDLSSKQLAVSNLGRAGKPKLLKLEERPFDHKLEVEVVGAARVKFLQRNERCF